MTQQDQHAKDAKAADPALAAALRANLLKRKQQARQRTSDETARPTTTTTKD